MSDIKPMPAPVIVSAGWLIVLCALAGLALGVMRDLKGHGGPDAESGEVVAPIKTVANATPLTAPPVTEADVRRWTREELAAQHAAAPPRKPKDDGADATDAAGSTALMTPPTVNLTTPKPPGPATAKPQSPAQPIPF